MKKTIGLLMTLFVILTLGVPVYAQGEPSEKEEAVYGILYLDGSVKSLCVVNAFYGGDILDYGEYSEIRNLTTAEALTSNGDEITAHTDADRFFYQGTLDSKELPWNFSMLYTLDGQEIPGEELAGKSGALEIRLGVTRNDRADESFFDGYALQIGMKLDAGRCDAVQAPDATVAQAGGFTQLTFTLLPGNEAEYTVKADVSDFEMDAVTINGIRLAMNLEFDDAELKDQLAELADAIAQMDDGALELKEGMAELADGMDSYVSGMGSFVDGLNQLKDAVGSVNTGAGSLRDGLAELSDQSGAIVSGALAVQQSTFNTVNQQIAAMNLGLPVLTPENYAAVLGGIPEFAAMKAQLDAAIAFAAGISGYTDGVAQIASGASDLADGTSQLHDSVSTLPSAASSLYCAASDILSGLGKLRDGLADYQDGTSQLKDNTSGLDTQMEEKIREAMDTVSGGGDGVVSFVSEKNTHVNAVQFILKTEPIRIPEVESPPVQEPLSLTFWQKLLALFGIGE